MAKKTEKKTLAIRMEKPKISTSPIPVPKPNITGKMKSDSGSTTSSMVETTEEDTVDYGDEEMMAEDDKSEARNSKSSKLEDEEMEDVRETLSPSIESDTALEEKKRLLKLKRQEAREARKRGDPPPNPCKECGSMDHWLKKCPVRAEKIETKRKEKEAKEKAEAQERKEAKKKAKTLETPSSMKKRQREVDNDGPKSKKARQDSILSIQSSATDVSVRPTKRPEREESDSFSDGSRLVIKLPPGLKGEPAVTDILRVWNTANLPHKPQRLTTLKSDHWSAIMVNSAQAEACAGKTLTWKKGLLGLKKDETTSIETYSKSGPSSFVCTKISTMEDRDIITKICQYVSETTTFWYGKDMYDGVEGGSRLLVFSKPQKFNELTFTMARNYKVLFRAVDRNAKCVVCRGPHKVVTCGAWVATTDVPPEHLGRVLTQRPDRT